MNHFTIINFDGWNVGFNDGFSWMYLEFDSFETAREIALHWDKWINEE